MQGASRESLIAAQDRLSALLESLDGQSQLTSAAVGDQLFELADLLDDQPALRASLTDPAREGDDKATLVRSLLSGKLSEQVVEFVEGTVRSRWSTNRDLANAIDSLGAAAVVASAQQNGRLDNVEDELFRFSRLVAAEPALRSALTDRSLPDDRKAEVIDSLLRDKVSWETNRLTQRAVTNPRGRSLEVGLASLAELAAAHRRRLVATVTTAVMLTEGQRERLAASLARQFGHDVHLNVVIDPEVIGGIRVTLGDEMIDGSLASRLDEARRRITG